MSDRSQNPPANAGGLSFIDQLSAIAVNNCSKPNAPLLVASNDTTRETYVTKAACGMWDCPECAARMGKRWIARTVNGMNSIGGQWYLCTLTVRPHDRTPEKSRAALAAGWTKLRKRVNREYGKFQYVRVYEFHRDGSFHAHMIMNAPIPTKKTGTDKQGREKWFSRWLKDAAHECGLGFIADYRPIANAGLAAGYVAKYTMKQMGPRAQFHWIPNMRRIEASRDFPKLPEIHDQTDTDWKFAGGVHQLETVFWQEFLRQYVVYSGLHGWRKLTTDDFLE